ncbi:MAG: cys-tRNA(pro)/cys-tRNA(cys) deacylase [Herpetosiphonaceae bacterium]|nr:MAG: cys-tRNA(pro)/cys-tRNA(cys) deacylase [Herpetosiphonaceae bacterium]
MIEEFHPSVQRVQQALRDLGFVNQVRQLAAATRTAADAASALGCAVGQIAKSLVFRGEETGRPVLVIASGANRVNERAVAELLGEPIAKANADFVRQHTGFVIGGVPPVGHPEPLVTIIDQDLMRYAEIWAAAGHPHAVFSLTPAELVAMTSGRVASITA